MLQSSEPLKPRTLDKTQFTVTYGTGGGATAKIRSATAVGREVRLLLDLDAMGQAGGFSVAAAFGDACRQSRIFGAAQTSASSNGARAIAQILSNEWLTLVYNGTQRGDETTAGAVSYAAAIASKPEWLTPSSVQIPGVERVDRNVGYTSGVANNPADIIAIIGSIDIVMGEVDR